MRHATSLRYIQARKYIVILLLIFKKIHCYFMAMLLLFYYKNVVTCVGKMLRCSDASRVIREITYVRRYSDV